MTGVSGSGKSTLIQDTLGLYPDEVGTRLMYACPDDRGGLRSRLPRPVGDRPGFGNTRSAWQPHDSLVGREPFDKVIPI